MRPRQRRPPEKCQLAPRYEIARCGIVCALPREGSSGTAHGRGDCHEESSHFISNETHDRVTERLLGFDEDAMRSGIGDRLTIRVGETHRKVAAAPALPA